MGSVLFYHYTRRNFPIKLDCGFHCSRISWSAIKASTISSPATNENEIYKFHTISSCEIIQTWSYVCNTISKSPKFAFVSISLLLIKNFQTFSQLYLSPSWRGPPRTFIPTMDELSVVVSPWIYYPDVSPNGTTPGDSPSIRLVPNIQL